MKEIFKKASALSKTGATREALYVLRDALRRDQLDAESIEKAGRLCETLFARQAEGGEQGGPAAVATTNVLILGQCTTSWLTSVLTAVAWGQGGALRVREGQYDNVIQEILAIDRSNAPDVVILIPWNQRLLGSADRAPEERADGEVAFWTQAAALVRERLGSRIVLVGYDNVTFGALGLGLGAKGDGDVALVRRVNERLRQSLGDGVFFVDLEQVSGSMGRERFYDLRRYHWTKQPFSEAGAVRLAQHLWAGVRALRTGPKKVLVLDLDHTLWGGVVGETGPHGIEIGEGPDGQAYRAFQAYVKRLAARGVVLTVCSKNNPADARGPFEQNPHMLLSINDFAHFEACWEPKAAVIRRTADVLQLGLDSFVFFDDNPAEREQVRQASWDVEVVEVPADPAEYVRALDRGLYFESLALTSEDRQRADQYRVERDRRDVEQQFESIDDYLASLQMTADIRPITEGDLGRVVQLIGKTNQFNLTTRRHSDERVRQMLAQPGTIGLTVRAADRFGDYGLVSVLLAVADPGSAADTLEIDTWLMSCRVINRTVEECLFAALVDEARRRGIRHLVGRYIPTAKNMLVDGLFERLGFVSDPSARAAGADERVYGIALDAVPPIKTFVQWRKGEFETSSAS